MAYTTVFKRYELKYMITREQMQRVITAMEPNMQPDRYGRSTVRNIYYDTGDYILARHSIARPDYKEKLRIRSYAQADVESDVFVELKRKFDHVVYKRRVALPERSAMAWTAGARSAVKGDGAGGKASPQMISEIEYFLAYYRDLKPAVFLSYDRVAYRMRDDAGSPASDLRVTFDSNILCRDHDLSLRSEVYGDPVIDGDKVLMELKCSGGIPLWMTEILSAERIYKTSFSKYGTAYTKYILPELQQSRSAIQPQVSEAQEKRAAVSAQPQFPGAPEKQTAAASPHRPHFGWHPARALAKLARASMF